jgi:hypothetical protein
MATPASPPVTTMSRLAVASRSGVLSAISTSPVRSPRSSSRVTSGRVVVCSGTRRTVRLGTLSWKPAMVKVTVSAPAGSPVMRKRPSMSVVAVPPLEVVTVAPTAGSVWFERSTSRSSRPSSTAGLMAMVRSWLSFSAFGCTSTSSTGDET